MAYANRTSQDTAGSGSPSWAALTEGRHGDVLQKSLVQFLSLHGTQLEARSHPFSDWCERRWQSGVSPYGRIMAARAGSRAAEALLSRVLAGDPAMGVIRHADAGYPSALRWARRHAVPIPMRQRRRSR